MPQVQIQITSESVLFLPLSFFTLGEYNLISTLSEVICICTCGMYLRVPEGCIWRLLSEQVGGV